MGTPDFAVPSLEILLKNNYRIAAVVTAPDKPRGRGQQVSFTPVKEFALKHSLSLLQPESLNDADFICIPRFVPPRSFCRCCVSDLAAAGIFNPGERGVQPACVPAPEVSRGGADQLGHHQRRKRIGRHDIFPPGKSRHGEHHSSSAGRNSRIDDCRRIARYAFGRRSGNRSADCPFDRIGKSAAPSTG